MLSETIGSYSLKQLLFIKIYFLIFQFACVSFYVFLTSEIPNTFLVFQNQWNNYCNLFFLPQKMKLSQGNYPVGDKLLKAASCKKPLRKISQNMGFL